MPERILLINPGQIYYTKAFRASGFGSLGLPLGLLYIAGAFEEKGCHVRVLDALVSAAAGPRKFSDHIYYGISENRIREKIKEFQPHIVGITNSFMAQEESLCRVARIVRETVSSALLIVGGANMSHRGRQVMAQAGIDIVIKGEGEKTVAEIVDYCRGQKSLEQVRGILFRRSGEISESGPQDYINDLDALPLPAYALLDMEQYLTLYKKGIYTRDRDVRRNVSMITSRGCPFRCIFCSVSQSMGKKWRSHSAAYIKKHILLLSRTYRVRHIHFEDDNLFFDLGRFLSVLEVLTEEKISWDTPNGIRVDLALSEEILAQMKRAGCKSLTIGVESGDPRILRDVVKKDIRLEDVTEFARRCQKVKLPLRAFFIQGFPGETQASMQKTADFALELLEKYDVEIMNFIATPLCGTELYRLCEEKGYLAREITPQAMAESTVSDGCGLIKTPDFDTQDVECLSRAFTAKVYRRLMIKGLRHPIASLRRVGNFYTFLRTLRRLCSSK